MLEFEELAFKQAVTYCDNNLTIIPLKNQNAVYIGGSNGAGKSLPFNVLYNVLFGYTPLSSKGKRKLIANPGYYAHVKFKLNNTSYEIRQFFDNPDFEYEGYDILKNGQSLKIGGGIPEAEKYIAKLLPFTAEEFSSFYYLSQDGLHVLAYGKGSERLAYLSKVFGFDIYDEIRAKLKIKLDEVDNQLADISRAHEHIDRLAEYLKKYPSLEVLDNRIKLCEQYLHIAKKERSRLDILENDIQKKLTILSTRKNIEASITKCGKQRSLKDIQVDIQKWQKRQSDYQVYLKQWQTKKKLLQNFSVVKDYLKEDIFKLNSQLDSLMQERGKASIVNKQIKQKREYISYIDHINLKITAPKEKIPEYAKKYSKGLIEKSSALSDKKQLIKELSTLSSDGSKCSRCGQSLDKAHIEEELKKLNFEITELNSLIKQYKEYNEKFQRELKFLNEIQKYQNILDSIQCPDTDTEIDINALNTAITKVKEQLTNAKEAQRLKKELQNYTKYDKIKAKTILEQLPKIQIKLTKLQEEFGLSREKVSLEAQLAKMPLITEKDVQESNLSIITQELSFYDEIILILSSELAVFGNVQNIVKDYQAQIAKESEKVQDLDKISSFRKIVNTCYKAYMPAHLKKIQISKVSELIAQKLNVFVPLIFNENITFTVDSNENSVDIFFKRGDHQARDVRFLNGGFKKRFLIALIPTLAGLISARKRTNLIILDEICANVDDHGREAIGEFLVPFLKTKFKTIIMISPSTFSTNGNLEASIPLDHFNKIWIASYKKGVSSLRI